MVPPYGPSATEGTITAAVVANVAVALSVAGAGKVAGCAAVAMISACPLTTEALCKLAVDT
ncbi:MAG: hypothetical protein EXR49_05370 [Dehalococcoidia bacterium]|nr:hypothetical protein [Dehalococcoidia bacterium]